MGCQHCQGVLGDWFNPERGPSNLEVPRENVTTLTFAESEGTFLPKMLLKQRGKFYILKKDLQNPEMLKLSKLSQFVWGKGALEHSLNCRDNGKLKHSEEFSDSGSCQSKLSKFCGSIGPNYPNRPRKP